ARTSLTMRSKCSRTEGWLRLCAGRLPAGLRAARLSPLSGPTACILRRLPRRVCLPASTRRWSRPGTGAGVCGRQDCGGFDGSRFEEGRRWVCVVVADQEGNEEEIMLVRDRMSRNPITARPDASVPDALKVMQGSKVRQLPVLNENNELVGI